MGKQSTQSSQRGVGPAGRRSNDGGRWVVASLGEFEGAEFFFRCSRKQYHNSSESGCGGVAGATACKTNERVKEDVGGLCFSKITHNNIHMYMQNVVQVNGTTHACKRAARFYTHIKRL